MPILDEEKTEEWKEVKKREQDKGKLRGKLYSGVKIFGLPPVEERMAIRNGIT